MIYRSAVAFANVSSLNKAAVLSIGGFNARLRLWRIPAEEAVVLIQSRLWAFFIDDSGPQIELAVVAKAGGQFRLTTTAGDRPLLALPEYPSPFHDFWSGKVADQASSMDHGHHLPANAELSDNWLAG